MFMKKKNFSKITTTSTAFKPSTFSTVSELIEECVNLKTSQICIAVTLIAVIVITCSCCLSNDDSGSDFGLNHWLSTFLELSSNETAANHS